MKLRHRGSFLKTNEAVIFTIKCWKLIIHVVVCQSDSIFLCVSGDDAVHIYKYNSSTPQNPILLLTPMCQDTPCPISDFHVYLCNFSELIFGFTQFHQRNIQKGGFGVVGTFLQLFNIANHVRHILSNKETLVRKVFPGGA